MPAEFRIRNKTGLIVRSGTLRVKSPGAVAEKPFARFSLLLVYWVSRPPEPSSGDRRLQAHATDFRNRSQEPLLVCKQNCLKGQLLREPAHATGKGVTVIGDSAHCTGVRLTNKVGPLN